MKRQLREDKLIETVEKIRDRIAERFPDSGLSRVAAEVVQITRDAVVRAKAISEPNWWLRGGLVLLVVIAGAGIGAYVQTQQHDRPPWQRVLHFLDEAKGSAAVLVAAAVFLVTLETRLKRRRAVQAVHELRSIAHIIDMHQLAKDPDRLGHPTRPIDSGGRPMDADAMGRYLHYCTELLAVLSKVGQLYVQDFPDTAALAAVDHFEGLSVGLSGKIWQKLMILDRIRSDAGAVRTDGASGVAATPGGGPPAVPSEN
jgi:hypothetical protein